MQLISYIIFFPIIWLISKLPFRFLYLLSDGLFYFLYTIIGYRKKLVYANLKLAFPNKSERELLVIQKKFYKHLCDVFVEMAKSLHISKQTILKRYKVLNKELLIKYSNSSIIIVCGHYASWEWSVSLGYHTSHTSYAIYSKIKNLYFDKLMHKIRGRFNAFLIERRHTIDVMEKHFNENKKALYGFASDQSPQLHKTFYWSEFMGVNIPVNTGFEILAKKYNYPVVFLDVQKIKRGYYQASFKLIEQTPKLRKNYALTDQFIALLESQIKHKPEYYFWTHNRWKHKNNDPTKNTRLS